MGGDVVGTGMGAWLSHSSAFSAERIRTPL
jgi:hypothetical protein